MSDPNEKARIWLRHLMEQLQEQVAKSWIIEQLLYSSHPTVSREQWEQLIKLVMTAPQMKEQIANSQKVIDQSMNNFDDTIKLHEAKQQLAQAEKEVEDLEKKFVDLVSQLPTPKLPN